ncbi:MAG: CDP-alcohol phosphatidyltransferase family protein [Acidobacteria bacterium]|jgi:CDP-diacylglycerol--glycerol-3-phosphate 3-phosphatidyltransferase|nr:MAG: CDP-alcohol phosphatidyltransferase family protein [Acidobacteriota bacterium]
MPLLITLIRFFLIFPTLYFLERDSRLLAFFLVLFAGLSDWLDGEVARKTNNTSRVGALLDPMVDKAFVLSVLSFFLYVKDVQLLAFVLLLLRELFLSFLRSLAVEKGYVMKASYLGKAKAFFEFLTLLSLCLGLGLSSTLLWLSVAFAYLSLYDYMLKYLTFERR